jgi:signal transduction histidine kinase
MTTLIVDDNETNRKLLRLTLEAEGVVTKEAADGVEALALLEHQRVDAIISDILMPRMDGYRLCAQVRESKRLHDLPVIIYSSTYTSPADEQLALNVGADRYITKPAPAQVLLDAIRESCTVAARQRRRSKPLPEELATLREYSDALVRKLEERNAELVQARKDLTQFNQELEQKVDERTAELERTKRSLESFAYTVSHDLRAPMRHITAFSQLVLDEPSNTLTDRSRQHLILTAGAAGKMERMIEGLLRLASLGKAGLQLATVDLSRLVEEARRELEPDNREIDWHIDPLPKVVADPTLLSQVFTNLLSNARKFTRDRPVARIEVGSRPGQAGEVEVFVRDNGAGFDGQYAKKLFGVFQRMHTEKQFEGTGIGLATVQAIVEQHGGKVWAEGEVDQGATFYFTLKSAPIKSR